MTLGSSQRIGRSPDPVRAISQPFLASHLAVSSDIPNAVDRQRLHAEQLRRKRHCRLDACRRGNFTGPLAQHQHRYVLDLAVDWDRIYPESRGRHVGTDWTLTEQTSERGEIASEKRQDRIQQARIYLEGARADLRAMVHPGVDPTTVQQSAERFGMAQGRLAAIERIGPPQEGARKAESEKPSEQVLPLVSGLARWLKVASAPTRPHRPAQTPSYADLLNPFVNRFGKWAGTAEVGMFDPVVA
jgi:hypothetical protein